MSGSTRRDRERNPCATASLTCKGEVGAVLFSKDLQREQKEVCRVICSPKPRISQWRGDSSTICPRRQEHFAAVDLERCAARDEKLRADRRRSRRSVRN